jgi:hypothetical protein
MPRSTLREAVGRDTQFFWGKTADTVSKRGLASFSEDNEQSRVAVGVLLCLTHHLKKKTV